ncbi:MAG TPA: response regulator [Aggregatilineales bacterium]|nr:response regulator [Aggregatilineales bacterium]
MSQVHALIIDDNLQNLKVLAQLLSKQNITCTEIADTRKLPTMLDDLQHVSVVFLDLEMPSLNGYNTKEMLRSHFGNIPIIAYTVHVSEINVVRDAGFDGFLGKPVDTARFPEQLARILRGEPVWDRA